MKIKGGMLALAAIKYEEELFPKIKETLEKMETEILSQNHWIVGGYESYLARAINCSQVIELCDMLYDLAGSLYPEVTISWELFSRCLESKGFSSDLIKLVYSFLQSAVSVYEDLDKLTKEVLTFDSQYNVYVYPQGAYVGDLEIKMDISYPFNGNKLLISNDYYASLIQAGCELTIGPHFIDSYSVVKKGVYCNNYKEMFELGILGQENTMPDIFGGPKK